MSIFYVKNYAVKKIKPCFLKVKVWLKHEHCPHSSQMLAELFPFSQPITNSVHADIIKTLEDEGPPGVHTKLLSRLWRSCNIFSWFHVKLEGWFAFEALRMNTWLHLRSHISPVWLQKLVSGASLTFKTHTV